MSLNELMMSLEIGLIYGIVAIGIYLTFRIIDFPDLTCDGSFVLGAAASGILIKNGYNPYLGILVALVAGGMAGLVTGILNTCLKVTDLLSGILVTFMLYSINLKVMGGLPNIALIQMPTIFTGMNALIVFIIISLIIWGASGYLLKSDFGLALRSIGQNKQLALINGVHLKKMVGLGLILSNSLIALGGALFSQHQSFVDVGSGVGTVIIGLASVMIGERLFRARSPWIGILACLVGSVIYRLFISFALHAEILGLETQDLNLVTGLMVIGIMALPRRKLC